jgi:hypothetical protein
MQEKLLTNLWPNCSCHCTPICVFEESKLTAVVVVGQLRVRKKYDELFMAVKADRKQNAKQFNPQLLLFFQARRRREQLAKHNAKDDARPKAKLAYHCMNELEDDDSDEEDSAHGNAELSDNENNTDSDNENVHRPMNVFAL